MIALDIETTGTDPTVNGILSIAAIEFNPATDYNFKNDPAREPLFDNLIHFTSECDADGMLWDRYCLDLHDGHLARLKIDKAQDRPQVTSARMLYDFKTWITSVHSSQPTYHDGKRDKLIIIGKNVHFDMSFILHCFPELKSIINYAYWDVGQLYGRLPEKIPQLADCVKFADERGCNWWEGTAREAHTAMSDTLDVVKLTCWAYQNRHGWAL